MKKPLIYSLLGLGLFGLLGVGAASANGLIWHFGGASPQEFAQRQEAMFENQANLLGIDVGQIKNAWAEGKGLKEIADEQGITQEQFQERMKEARQEQMKAQIQAMVDNGVISQEQADKRLVNLPERGDRGFGKGFMRLGGCFENR